MSNKLLMALRHPRDADLKHQLIQETKRRKAAHAHDMAAVEAYQDELEAAAPAPEVVPNPLRATAAIAAALDTKKYCKAVDLKSKKAAKNDTIRVLKAIESGDDDRIRDTLEKKGWVRAGDHLLRPGTPADDDDDDSRFELEGAIVYFLAAMEKELAELDED